MTLKGQYVLRDVDRASFGARHENLKEDRRILSAAKCSPRSLLSGGSWRYSRGLRSNWASNDSGVLSLYVLCYLLIFFANTLLRSRPVHCVG